MSDTDILDLRRTFQITLSEAALVACLLDGQPASHEKLGAAPTRIDGLLYRSEGCARVMLTYARRKLERFGVEIDRGNKHHGPSLSQENIDRIRAWVAASSARLTREAA